MIIKKKTKYIALNLCISNFFVSSLFIIYYRKYIYKKKITKSRGELGSWNAEAMMIYIGSASGSKARPRYRCSKAPDQLADMEQAIRYDRIKMAIHHCESVRIRVSTRVALAHSFAN